MMNRVIISGVSGFVGNAVARMLLAQGVEVVGIVKNGVKESEEAFRIEDLDIELYECNLNQISELPERISQRGFDVFYQFAWDGLSIDGLNDYRRQMENVKWMADTITAATALQCNKVVGAGSVTQTELFTSKGRYFSEDKHKYFRAAQLASEIVCRGLAKEKGIEFIWPIIVNIYGEGETNSRLINSLIGKMIKGVPFPLSSGEQRYDFVHIEDAARAFCLIGEKGNTKSQYVIASGNVMKLKDYIIQLRDIIAPEYELCFSNEKFSGYEIEQEWLDISALKKDTGFEPRISFEEGVNRVVKWIER